MTGLFLFLGGCQKDENNTPQTNYDHSTPKIKLIHLDSFPKVARFLQKNLKLAGTLNSFFTSDDIDRTKVLRMEHDPGEVTYTMPINHDLADHWTYNIVIVQEDSILTDIKVVGLEHISTSEVVFHHYEFATAFGGNTRNRDLLECWSEYVSSIRKEGTCFDNKDNNNGNSGGGTGNSSNNGDNRNWFGDAWQGWWIDTQDNGGPRDQIFINPLTTMQFGITSGGGGGGCDCWWQFVQVEGEYILKRVCRCYYTLTDEHKDTRELTKGCIRQLRKYGYIDVNCNPLKDLGEELMQECKLANPALAAKIAALKGNIVDPCTGKIFNLEKLERQLCLEDIYDEAEFDKKLKENLYQVDNLKIDTTFKQCKALNCIYEKLYNSGSKMFCNNIYRFHYSDKIDLKIKVGTTDWNAEGTVAMSTNGTGVIMTFAKFNCNETDHLKLAETILHESFHAKLRFDIAKNNNVSEAEFRAKFLTYIQANYGVKYNSEHKIMLKEYFDKAAAELMALNGNKYDISFYKAYVWDGLSDDFPNLYDKETIDDWKEKRKILKADLSTFQCK
jgi:hypothetical protein